MNNKKLKLNNKNLLINNNFHNINLINSKTFNLKMFVEKIQKNKFKFRFIEKIGNKENIYDKIITLKKDIKDYSKMFFINLFKKIKESFIKTTIILFSILYLVSCNNLGNNIELNSNETLTPYILNNNFSNLGKYYKSEINYLNNFNNFISDVYKQKKTTYITIPKKFQEFINNEGQIYLKDIIDYVNKNSDNKEKMLEIYNIDWTIFQRGSLYELLNPTGNHKMGDLGEVIKDSFKKDYGDNYKTYTKNEILGKKIILVSNFIKSPIFNGQDNIEDSKKLLSLIEQVTGKINDEKSITINDLIKINNSIIEYGEKTNNKTLKNRGIYGTYILNNLIFLLTQTPSEYVDNLLSNNLKFEIGYGDNGYLDIMGHIIYSKNSKINYDINFVKYVKDLNSKLKDKNIEIILDTNSIIITEKKDVVIPGEIKSLIKFFRSNPDSELKKILINSTTLSDYMVYNSKYIDKGANKSFFIEGVSKLVNGFKKDFNLNDTQIDNLFKYGNINGNVSEINVYGVNINISKKIFNNKFIPDYYEKILINNPNFTTLIHESSHKEHLNIINNNLNNLKFDFINELSAYPYTSNYVNDPIFKKIFTDIFYKAYKGEITTKELDYFGYYALSTFNYFEFIAELNSAYLSYPGYHNYIKNNDYKNSKLFLDIQSYIHNELKKQENIKK